MYCLHVFLRSDAPHIGLSVHISSMPNLEDCESASPVSNEVNDPVLPLTHAVPIGVARDLFDKRHLFYHLSRPWCCVCFAFFGVDDETDSLCFSRRLGLSFVFA